MEDEKRDELLTAAHYSKFDATLEVREENGERVIEGYAAKYGVEANIGPFKETISRGAFAELLLITIHHSSWVGPQLVLWSFQAMISG